MALVGTIIIGMQASTSALAKGLGTARGMISGFANQLGGVNTLVAGAFAGSGMAAMVHLAGLADDLADNVERLSVVFGDASETIVAQAETMNAAFGTSEITFTSLAQKLGGMFQGADVGADAAAEMTGQLMTLGQAIANFKGISIEQAMGQVQAGLRGRGKALQEYGINISQAAIKDEAYASGLATTGSKLDAAAKMQAAFNILMREGSGVIGAMDQRATDAGNSWNEFTGRLEQVQILLGQSLPEVVEPFFKELNVGLVAAMSWWEDLRQTTLNWGTAGIESAKSTVEGMGWVQKSVGFVADAMDVLKLGFKAVQSFWTAWIAQTVEAYSLLAKGFDYLMEKMTGSKSGAGDFMATWAEDLHNLSGSQWDELQKMLVKPWPSEAVNTYFDNAQKKIHDLRTEVAKTAMAAGGVAPGVAPGKAPAAAHKGPAFAAAMGAGSKEAASTILRSKYGIGDDSFKKIAANSDKQTALLERIAGAIEDVGSGVDALDSL